MKKKYHSAHFSPKTGLKKLLLIMRLSIVLNLLCTVAFSANSFSQNQNFSVNLENAKVRDVFRTIENQSTYRFFYNDELTDINRMVSMNVKDSKIEDVLAQLFTNTDISYTILENNLIVIAPKRAIQQQKVSGTVTDDETGEPLPGVSVLVEGTSIGAITDLKGKYSVDAPKDATLTFSFMGFMTERVAVSGSVIDVKLKSDVKKLDEVVVVGYGVQRKEAVTGSVASVRGDILRDVPSANITTALQGRIAGVDLSQTDTKPGSSMQIRIRGVRSLNASNDPLVVLDGIPFAGSIGDIDPSVIKSVDILKDASATAIYGSRGANGVILITSTKGKSGKATFNYNGYYGVKKIFAKYPMMNGSEFAALRKTANANGYTSANTADENDANNTDWQDLLFKTGVVTSHDLSVSGGSEKGNFSVGAGYYRDEAVVPLQNYSRYSMRSSVEQDLSKYIRLGFTTNSNYSVSNGFSLTSVATALGSSPLASIYNPDGSIKRTYLQATSGAQWVSTRSTLEALGDQYIDQTRAYSTYNTAYGEVKIPGVEGLKYRINLGLNYRQSNYGNYVGQGVFSGNASTISSATVRNENTINWAVENLLTYDRAFAKKHMVNIVALYSSEQTTYNKATVQAKDIPSDAFQFYNLGVANQAPIVDPGNDAQGNPYQLYQQSGLMSVMGRAMYTYDDRYMISATFRSDASSRLAPGHQWHSYPAVSAGWNIAKESFMRSIPIIDQLKLRAGFGQTSNQSVDPYKTLGLLSTLPYNFGQTNYSTGYYVSQLPNPDLGWEFSETWNYGLDFSVLNHRIFGTLEYYTMNTKNVLLSVALPATSGVGNPSTPGSYTANIGKTENKGWEFSLNGVILQNPKGFTWEAGVNIYMNRNKLVAMASGQQNDKANWWFLGYPIDVIYDFKKVGLWQPTDQFLTNYEGTAAKPGMIKVKYSGTYNADGSPTRAITDDDKVPISLEPNFEGGFNTRLAYKGIDLSIVGVFKNGGILNSTLYGSSSYLNNDNARSNNNVKIDYWTPTNTGAKYPAPGGLGGDNPKYGSTLGYFSASYLKVRTITLGYNLPQNWVKRVGIQNLRIYCTAQNPFVLFSPYKDVSGMDPETNSTANVNAASPLSNSLKRLLTIGTNTPTTRNYLFGINLTF